MRQPQAENSVAALQLFNALPGSLAISVDDIVEAAHPPAEMSVLALQLHTAQSFAEELPIELRDEMPLVRALGLEQRVLAGPLALHVAGRPLGHQSSREAGSVLVRPRSGLLQEPCLHASEGRRGSHIEQLRRFEIIKKARKREDEKTRARDLSFFQVPTVYAQQRLSRSGSVGAGPRGGGPTRNSITRSKGAEPGGA